MEPLQIIQVPVLVDNYIYLLHEHGSGKTAVVDPAVPGPVVETLKRQKWTLDYIFNTHHHGDHTGANLALKKGFGCVIYGPRADAHRIPGIDRPISDGDEVFLGGASAQVFHVPGHTSGHIAYYFGKDRALFCGDTLFSLGCGRLFEGTPQQMWTSLGKLRRLDPESRIYCAHEYTEANGRFALSIDPDNKYLQNMFQRIQQLRRAGQPTVPSRLKDELQANPFLRADDPSLQQSVGMIGAEPATVFGEIRRRKDTF